MLRSLLKEASIYSFASWLGRGFSLITIPIYTRILGTGDYGALDLLSNLAIIVSLIVGMGLDQAVVRFYVDAKDEKYRKTITTTVLAYTIAVLALVLLPVSLLTAEAISVNWLNKKVDGDTVQLVFMLAGINLFFSNTANLLRYNFRASQFAWLQVSTVVLSGVLCISLVVWGQLGVYGIFLGQAISQGLFGLLAIVLCRANYGRRVDWKLFCSLVRFSAPLMPSTLIFFVMQYVDRYIINIHLGLEQVGIYGIAARVALLADLFLTGFQAAWWPQVMKTYAQAGSPARFASVFNYYVLMTGSLIVGLSLFSQELLAILVSEQYRVGFTVVPMLVASVVLGSINNYFTYGIQIFVKSFYRLWINIFGLLVNIGLTWILVIEYGVIGAAFGTFVSFLLMTTVAMVVSQKLYTVPYRWFRIVAVYCLVTLTGSLVIIFQIPIRPEFIAGKFGVSVIVLLLMSCILQINPLRSVWLISMRRVVPT